jgi:hypothetical protein
LPFAPKVSLTKDLIFTRLLPPLLFEAAFYTGVLLLLIAGIVAMLTRRVRLPYSVGLVAAGIILGQ